MCIRDSFSKYTKLYPINRATNKKILDIIIHKYIPELAIPRTIITDHGTQFKGQIWKETLLWHGVKNYKTSVYHPSSNPAERVLQEVRRILRTAVSISKGNGAVSYTHLDVYKRQVVTKHLESRAKVTDIRSNGSDSLLRIK